MTDVKKTVLSWLGGAGIGMAFATGGWAMAVQKDLAEHDKRITQVEQPFIELRIEMSALREQVAALTRAMERSR